MAEERKYLTAPTILGRIIDAEDIMRMNIPGPWTLPAVFSQTVRTGVKNFRNRNSNNSNNQTTLTNSSTGTEVRRNNSTRNSQTPSTQVSSSRGSYGRVALTTPAATMRLSLPLDIITESIINTPILVNLQRNTQGSTTSSSRNSAQRTNTKPRTSSRSRTSVQRTIQQNTISPIQPTQTWRFTEGKLIAPKPVVNEGVESLEELTSQPILDNNSNKIYDRNYVRNLRLNNYSNVNQFLDYINRNPESDEARLLRQNGFDPMLTLEITDMLASRGIRGNLGRRDSRRLGNVLTLLRELSTVGTEAHNQFMQGAVDLFNRNKELYSPTEGKYAGRTFRNMLYDPEEGISFVGDTGKTMSGWFETPTLSQAPNWWTNLLKQRGLNNLIIGSNNTGGYNIATPPYFGFNRTLY